jgi:hypothetical protein
MVVVDGKGLPLGNRLDSAPPAEVTLVEKTLATIRVPHGSRPGRPRQKPERLIADKAYGSDPLRFRLADRGIELIAPHQGGRVRPPIQDGRPLRPRVVLPVCRAGGGPLPGVNLNDSAALLDILQGPG